MRGPHLKTFGCTSQAQNIERGFVFARLFSTPKTVAVVLSHLHTSICSRICTEQLLTVAGILGEGGRCELLKLEQRFPEAKNSGLVKLSCFLFTVAAFLFLLCHLHLRFAQHSPFR